MLAHIKRLEISIAIQAKLLEKVWKLVWKVFYGLETNRDFNCHV